MLKNNLPYMVKFPYTLHYNLKVIIEVHINIKNLVRKYL